MKSEYAEELKLRPTAFQLMLRDISALHIKYIQQLLADLNHSGPMSTYRGEYHRTLINHLENIIMERTILK